MCGEKLCAAVRNAELMGSLPRVRGKDDHPLNPLAGHGITPAYAGKSSRNETCWHRPWDHPRVCGEKAGLVFQLACPLGSPPRMRGKVGSCVCSKDKFWITPAYAGKSMAHLHPACVGGDHPHVCGEKDKTSVELAPGAGSPPRVRGKAGAAGPCTGGAGITPAYAGKRLWETPLLCRNGDHPRVYGEKSKMPSRHVDS